MKDKEFEAWKTSREQGKLKFVLIRGLLAWGIPMFIVMTLFVNKPETGFTTVYLAINAVIWSLGGLIFGLLLWYISEKRFEKELAKRNNI